MTDEMKVDVPPAAAAQVEQAGWASEASQKLAQLEAELKQIHGKLDKLLEPEPLPELPEMPPAEPKPAAPEPEPEIAKKGRLIE